MSQGPQFLQVLSGHHAGAQAALPQDGKVLIGSGADATIMLTDDGIDALHVELDCSDNVIRLRALNADVKIFGLAVQVNQVYELPTGSLISLHRVQLQTTGGEPCSPAMVRQAERTFLGRYARTKMLLRLSRRALRDPRAIGLGVLVLAAGIWLAQTSLPVPNRPAQTSLQRLFPNVVNTVDAASGNRMYSGYVETQSQLSQLTVRAWADGPAPIIRVFAIEDIQQNLAEFSAKYLRHVTVTHDVPGSFIVTSIPAPQSPRALEPDLGQLARAARREIAGVQQVRFVIAAGEPEPTITQPLFSTGMNLLQTRHARFLIDRSGAPFFNGAQTTIGVVMALSPCSADILRNQELARYQIRLAHLKEPSCG
ncbi:FHA domain-containing protein [Paraburkholderia hayleyella]|uniref:FHA domain-containing protein n=1 Tax=Paraburkholderia hayleyella TaxID=2152889 RepID=UPI001290E7D2|nr:FHA domain-containing protein [Paraburkholderia hayleyella]